MYIKEFKYVVSLATGFTSDQHLQFIQYFTEYYHDWQLENELGKSDWSSITMNTGLFELDITKEPNIWNPGSFYYEGKFRSKTEAYESSSLCHSTKTLMEWISKRVIIL